MPTLTDTIGNCEPMPNEPGRYLVKSKSGEGFHMVDLAAWEYQGECTCKDWECRIGFFLKSGDKPQKSCCKHIEQARWFMISAHMDTEEISRRLTQTILQQ